MFVWGFWYALIYRFSGRMFHLILCGRGSPGGVLAFLGLAFFLLNILISHAAIPRNAVSPEASVPKMSKTFLGVPCSILGMPRTSIYWYEIGTL